MKLVSILSLAFCAQAFGANAVGVWHMDEGSGQVVHDSSGSHNNGQLGSTTVADVNDPTWTPGKFGSGLLFAGATKQQWVQVPQSTSLSLTGSITVEAWIKLDAYGAVSHTDPVVAKWNDLPGRTSAAMR